MAVKLTPQSALRRVLEGTEEVVDAVQAVKLRYLNAMGIESWVRRSSPEAVSSMGEEPKAADSVVEMLAEEPVTAVRSLLEAEAGAAPAPVAPPLRPADGDAESPPVAPRSQPDPQPNPQPTLQLQATPEFRLLVLHLAGSVLLVDESLLDPGVLQAEQIHLLGDVLRSAHLLVHGVSTGSIEHQMFYWPQVDDATLDQGLPRAREALAYHLRSRLEGGGGPLLQVIQGPDLKAGSGSAIARDSMAVLTAMKLEVGAELLDLQAPGRVRSQVWDRLRSLEATPPKARP